MSLSIASRCSAGRYLANALDRFRYHGRREDIVVIGIARGGVPIAWEISKRLDVALDVMVIHKRGNDVPGQEQRELEQREQRYRNNKDAICLNDKTVIVADDGIASGATMRAALTRIRQQQPATIIIAIPVATIQAAREFRSLAEVDDIIYLATPEPFISIAHHYTEFNPVSDEAVCELLSM